MTDETKRKKAKKTSLYMPVDMLDALEAMARDQDRTVAYLTREAVARFLETMAYGPDERAA